MRTPQTLFAALVVLWPATAGAHVYLTSPADGAAIEAGRVVTISWEIAVDHGPPDTYDVMFSPDGGSQYEIVAEGLSGTPSSTTWTAPDAGVPEATLSILQHGADGYEYMHSVRFSIVGSDNTVEPPDAGYIDRPDADVPQSESGGVPTTAEEVSVLLDKRCAISGCHGANTPQAGLQLTADVFPRTLVDSRLVVPCDLPSSTMLGRLRASGNEQMPPPPELAMDAEQLAALDAWVSAGALATGSFDGTCAEAPSGGCSSASPHRSTRFGLFWALGALLVTGRRTRR